MGRSRSSPYKKPDHFTREAKKAGFPARSVWKLDEIDRRVRLFRAGMRVLDLGAAPGSWSLYAAEKIGPSGKLLAVDLSPLGATLPPHATFLQGDALSLDDGAVAQFAPYDVVLSDMAANATGHRKTDHLKIMALAETAALFARDVLRPGGAFLCKVLQGGTEGELLAGLKRDFITVKHVKPAASRADSAELYVLAMGFRASAAP